VSLHAVLLRAELPPMILLRRGDQSLVGGEPWTGRAAEDSGRGRFVAAGATGGPGGRNGAGCCGPAATHAASVVTSEGFHWLVKPGWGVGWWPVRGSRVLMSRSKNGRSAGVLGRGSPGVV